MKKILLITFRQDNSCIEMVSKAIKAKGGLPVRFNTDEYPGNSSLSVEFNNNQWRNILKIGETKYDLDEFEALWYRRIRIGSDIKEELEEKFIPPSVEESRRTFFGVLAALDLFKLDSVETVKRAGHKQLQLKIAERLGLKIPKTLITNDPATVRGFYDSCPAGVITKMQASFAIYENGVENVVYTNLLNEDSFEGLEELRYCPMTFQESLQKKVELRITVIGNRVFSASINSQKEAKAKDDWRKEGIAFMNQWQKFDLPSHIEKKLLALMDELKLNYGAIDMILTPDNEFYFLEVNPVGEFFWLEMNPGFPMSEAIADLLLGNAERRL
ncbi:MAG: MvdD family ATP-grasp ribosomal peptide maturase [Bacteroidetes bacterium]|nr:MvdD family ATP-grasp ribosomal peptide maturase [Bacteroidota bacterium]